MKKYALLMLLGMTACGGTLTKNVSDAQLAQDQADCQLEKDKAMASGTGYEAAMVYNDCFRAKGYQ